MKCLKTFDMFPVQVQLTFQKSTTKGSNLGFIVTLFTFALVILASIYVSQDIWLKESPFLAQTSYYDKQYIYLRDFPIMISILNQNHRSMENFENYVSLEATIFTIDNQGNTQYQTRNMIACNKKQSQFSQQINFFDSELKNYFCIDFEQNDYILGDLTTLNSTFIDIYILTSKSLDETESFFKNEFGIFVYFPNSLVTNANNYLSPLQVNPQSLYAQASLQLKKTLLASVGQQVVKSDDGLFFNNWTYYKGYSIVSTMNDYAITNKKNQYFAIGSVRISGNTQIQLTTRSYLKFSDALARIMGILGALTSIITILITSYQSFSFRADLYKELKNHGIKIQSDEIIEKQIDQQIQKNVTHNQDSSNLNISNDTEIYKKDLNYFEWDYFRVLFQSIKRFFSKNKEKLLEIEYIDQQMSDILSLENVLRVLVNENKRNQTQRNNFNLIISQRNVQVAPSEYLK